MTGVGRSLDSVSAVQTHEHNARYRHNPIGTNLCADSRQEEATDSSIDDLNVMKNVRGVHRLI